MKEIPLANGKVAFIDDEDYAWVSQWHWCATLCNGKWYVKRDVMANHSRSTILLHRALLGLDDPDVEVDHVDGNGLNNSRQNLRTCTHQLNQMNRPKLEGCTSKHKGVFWSKIRNKWAVQISVNKRRKHVGYFTDELAAAKAYNEAVSELYGRFPRLNRC